MRTSVHYYAMTEDESDHRSYLSLYIGLLFVAVIIGIVISLAAYQSLPKTHSFQIELIDMEDQSCGSSTSHWSVRIITDTINSTQGCGGRQWTTVGHSLNVTLTAINQAMPGWTPQYTRTILNVYRDSTGQCFRIVVPTINEETTQTASCPG